MITKFESHSDYVLATNILVSCIHQKSLFDDLVSLFFEANKSLGEILCSDIFLTKGEMAIISENTKKLWEKIEEAPEDKKLESLVHNFSDVVAIVNHIQQMNTADLDIN